MNRKKKQCDDVLVFNSAITLPEPRKPPVSLDDPVSGSFESPHAVDMPIALEDEKPVSVNRVPGYSEDIPTCLGKW